MPDPNQISCSYCGQPYAVRPEQWAQYHGRTINCTKCGQPFVVTAPPHLVAQPAPVAPPGGAYSAPPQQAPPPSPQFPSGYPPPPPPYGNVPPGHPPPYGPYPGGPYPGAMYPPPHRPTSGWALASLIVGIVGFCVPVLGGVIATITGIIGIIRTRDGKLGGRGMAVAGLVLGMISLLIVGPLGVAGYVGYRAEKHEQVQRAACKQNMTRLGDCLLAYAKSHDGRFPDRLEQLVRSGSPPPASAFVCPDDDKTPPAATPFSTMESDIASGRHCSYLYTGKGVTQNDDPETVILYEPLANHQRAGMHVLRVDGRVNWLDPDEAQEVLDDLNKARPKKTVPDSRGTGDQPASVMSIAGDG